MTSNNNSLPAAIIRPAKPEDCPEIMRLIIELAIFEKLENQVKIDAEVLKRDCFGEKSYFQCIVAQPVNEDSNKLIGYALYFPTYSTWEGVCVHMEDIYVTPAYRGKGIGKRLWQDVTQAALDLGCSRLQLSVLGWNKEAKDLYTRNGCIDMTETEDWHLMRLRRQDMEAFVKNTTAIFVDFDRHIQLLRGIWVIAGPHFCGIITIPKSIDAIPRGFI